MKKIEWLLLFALAAAGLSYVVSRADLLEPLARYGPIPSESFYESTARRVAADFGAGVEGWAASTTSERDSALRLATERNLVSPEWLLRSPYAVTFTFDGPDRQMCRVTLDSRGTPLRFFLGLRDEAQAPVNAWEPDAREVEEARAIAFDAFRSQWRFAIATLTADLGFQLTADAVVDGRDIVFEWTSKPGPAAMVAWKLTIHVRDGAVRRFDLAPQILENLRAQTSSYENTVTYGAIAAVAIGLSGFVWAFVLTVLNLFRGRLPWSFVLRTAIVVGVFLLAGFLTGAGLRALPPDWYSHPARAFNFLMIHLLSGAIATVVISAGRSARDASDFRRWLGVEDFLKLDWAKASVARAMWTAGLVAAIWVSAPYLALSWISGVLFDSATRQTLGLNIPFGGSLASQSSLAVLFVFTFCFPVLKVYVKSRLLRGILAVLLGAAAAGTFRVADFPWHAVALAAMCSGALMVYVYVRFGVLASVLGGILAIPLSRALFLTVLGDVTMQTWGIAFLTAASLVVAIAFVLDMRNPAREEEQQLSDEELALFERERQRAVLSQREQMLGDFALAQQAQERILPSQPPYVEGFEISAICKPALHVGGDLYDYLRLHDGRWTCCVADVSGKGVSAALYMTLTKGLLNALRLDRGDLMEIATVLNQRLYEVMRRRYFVTMSLAAIDSASRNVEVLRAGHLPMLLVEASGEARFVESQGMGLGLTPSTFFRQKLTAATVRMQPGDVAVLYSDGVTEAMNPRREEFGEARFANVVAAARASTAIEIRDRVMEEILRFQLGAEVHDDITMLVLKARDASMDERIGMRPDWDTAGSGN
ncbi:MAG: PP2C family protein-serine/threonine phosphatase [Bryobacterales bacterium]|nr:PP2C family protein-serine/threonine phosphatase [Bryobacterales bacterium]